MTALNTSCDMPEPLSSDILEEAFGPTRIRIAYQDDDVRIIRTETMDGRVLEISRVTFKPSGTAGFPDIHRRVVGGVSMGKAFRATGIPFTRHEQAIYSCELPEAFSRTFGLEGKATVVKVSVSVGEHGLHYADMTEVYSPAVDWPAGPREEPGQAVMEDLGRFARLLTDSAS